MHIQVDDKFGNINNFCRNSKQILQQEHSLLAAFVFDIYFTGFGIALTTILPILFQYCYKYCYSDSRNL
jgi:hypothetical protein